MNKANQHMSIIRKNDIYSTPQDFFDKLNNIHNFTLDVCANSENKKCDKYFSEQDNGLSKSWKGETCWMNPPYSKVKLWIDKAVEESKHAKIVGLIFAKTDTKWFHEKIYNKFPIEFIKGRLRFNNLKGYSPYPSMLIYFGY